MCTILFRGFTKFSRADYLKYKSEGRIVPDGVNAKVHHRFPLDNAYFFYFGRSMLDNSFYLYISEQSSNVCSLIYEGSP
jgi:hypothetical protein